MENVACDARSAATHYDIPDVGANVIDGDPFFAMRVPVRIHWLDDVDGLTDVGFVFCIRDDLFFNTREEHQSILSTNSTMLALTGAKPLSKACVASVLVT